MIDYSRNQIIIQDALHPDVLHRPNYFFFAFYFITHATKYLFKMHCIQTTFFLLLLLLLLLKQLNTYLSCLTSKLLFLGGAFFLEAR